MIGFNLLMEGALSIWYFKDAFYEASERIFPMLLIWVLYLCIKIVLCIGWEKPFAPFLAAGAAVAVAVVQATVFGAMAYFFMLCVTQALLKTKNNTFYISLLALGLFVFVPPSFQQGFLLFSIFTFIAQLILKTEVNRIETLQQKVEFYRIRAEEMKENALALKEFDVSAKYASRLEERNQIAQKLHDELGHTLSGSTMQLEAILLLLEKEPERARAMLTKVIGGLRQGTDEIRQILKDIKPEAASLNISNIKVLASNANERAGIKTEVIYDAAIADISQAQWQVITDNIREALTNMMKHSGATKAVISFERLHQLIKVTVKDNGRGAMHVKSGLGISGMEERCAALKGQLVVDGTHGFSVIMLLPVTENKESGHGN